MDSGVILQGRPHGGCLILYRSTMGNKVRFIKTNSKRVCSLCIDLVDVYLYLFCIFRLCDINTRENIDDYENVLAEISAILSTLNVPFDCIKCEDYLCTHTKHHDDVQYFHDRIISACTQAATDIPKTSQSSNIPGWNMHVEESKKTSLFWHDLWRINGSPRQGTIADIMRRTRAKYHYAIRYVKRMSETLKKQAMARAISENNSRELWQEVKKIRKNKSEKSYCIDNAIGEYNIASLFAIKYEELYNSVRYDEQSFSSIISENTDDIKSQCIVSDVDSDCDIIHTRSTTVQQIKCAISKMQSGKSDSIEQLSSDNFKNGTHMLNVYISLLFTCMLTHGIPPSGLLLSTIIPIPKNKRGNMSDSSNYRAIALSSLLCKLFDTIIIETHEDNLITDDLQFGYEKQSSTIVCTSLLLNTVEYHREMIDRDCYMLLLYASKAFDRVEYVKLFSDLRERKLCPIVLRLLMNMYVNQCLQVRWNSLVFDRFSIANGVKQGGGVLSPILFSSIYMDKLIKQLRNSNIGCKIVNQYVGVFCYTDDISLVCPSITGHKCYYYVKRMHRNIISVLIRLRVN